MENTNAKKKAGKNINEICIIVRKWKGNIEHNNRYGKNQDEK